MKFRRNKTAAAVAQALACLAIAGCGGGNQADSSAAAEPQDGSSGAQARPYAVSATGSGLQLDLISATGGSTLPYTVGQALKQGDVPSGSAVVADSGSLQFVVKNRWPDGSAKFAILSGRTDMAANTWKTIGLSVSAAPVAGVAVSTGDLAATGVTARVDYGSFGTATWNAGDWASPVQTFVSGPEMSAFTYRKPIGSDPSLVAWLEVRTYKGGRVEVLPWIENGYLKVAGPTSKSATAAFTLGGTQRFSQALTLLNHQRAVLASGTTLTHWFGASDPQVTPRHSAAYLMATKLVPNYRGVTGSTSPLFGRLVTSYTPLGQANFPNNMPDTGYAPGIGLLPEWDVAYLSSAGDPRALRAVIINGYAAGRYGTHFRDEVTNRPIAFSSYPTLGLGAGAGVTSTGGASTYTPDATGASPPTYDSPHHPSMGYMAYLITGWGYFLEETQLLAGTNFLKQDTTIRQGSKGIIESASGANITRGAAWAIRTLAQAAAITPDSDALHAEYVNSLSENISYYHGRYVAKANNPLGLVQPYDHMNGTTDPWTAQVWMDDFFTASFAWLKDLQVTTSAVGTKFDAFMAWKYNAVVGRLGASSTNTSPNGQYSYRYAAQYTLPFAPTNSADWSSGAGPWYANWGAVAAAMGQTADNGATTLQGTSGADPGSMATGYWGNLHPAIAYAVEHGAAGAAAAYTRLTSAPNYSPALFNDTPGWGVVPR